MEIRAEIKIEKGGANLSGLVLRRVNWPGNETNTSFDAYCPHGVGYRTWS